MHVTQVPVRVARHSEKITARDIAGLFKDKKELFKYIRNKMYPVSSVRHNTMERAEMFKTYFCSVFGKNPCDAAENYILSNLRAIKKYNIHQLL